MWSRLTGGESQGDVEAATAGSTDEREQQEFLIQQLKDLLRVNEERLQQKERELEENNAKFQKFKLQSKAKLQHLTNQIKAHDHTPSPDTDAAGEDTSSSGKHASLDPSEQSSRGRMLMLKRQLEETRLQYQKKEQEMENSKKALEAMVEQLQSQLVQRDKILMDLGASGDYKEASTPSPLLEKKAEHSAMEENRLYAQMVYKDSRILELNNQILELERRIMDLQENLKEKDEVLQARNKAIQLMTQDLSLRSKAAVDDLDDTRVEMRKMQQEFLTREKSWKEQEAHLQRQLASAESKLHEAEGHLRELEATRFDLAARNAELQQKVVLLQEAFEKQKTESEKVFQEELSAVRRELETKTAALEEVRSTLKETTNQSDAKILKARAMERRRAKALERELEELKQGAASNEQVTILQQRVAELEEEKGAIQLKMLEMEEALSAQASRLEEMQQKDNMIAELESQMKTAEGEKISLEMRAAEIEEQRDVAEKRLQLIQQELEVSRVNTESSAPVLEVEIKEALEEEVRRLNSQHQQDKLVIGELKEKVLQQEELLIKVKESLAVIEAEKNDAVTSLQDAERKMDDRDRVFSELTQSISELKEMLAQEQEAKGKLCASLAAREEEIRKALEDLGLSSLQEAAPMVQSLTRTYKVECEQLNKQLKARAKDNEDLLSEVTKLQQAVQELDMLRTQLKGIEDSFQHFSVRSMDELKAKWSSLQQEMPGSVSSNVAEMEKLDAELTRQADELRTLTEAIAQKEECIGCLGVEVRKWQKESEQKDQQLTETKLHLDRATKELESLKDVSSSQRAKADSKISNLLEQSADLEKEVADLRLTIEEKTSVIQELEKQLVHSTAEAEELKKEMQKLGRDFTMREESLKQQLEAALADSQKCSQYAESYKSMVAQLEGRLSTSAEEMAEIMSSSEKQVRTLEEQIVTARAELQTKCTESSNFESLLSRSEENRKNALEELRLVQEEKDDLQENVRQLKDKLNTAESNCMEVKVLLEASSKEVDEINKRLMATVEEKICLENMYAHMTNIMATKEHEVSQASSELSNIRESLHKINDENMMYKDTNSQLLQQIEALKSKLIEQEAASSALTKKLSKHLETMRNEKVSLEGMCKGLEDIAERKSKELEDASKSHSDTVEKYQRINKQNEQLKGKLKKLSKDMSDMRLKFKETEEAAKAQHAELGQSVDTLEMGKQAIEAQCAELRVAVTEKQEEIDRLTDALSDAQHSIEKSSEENLQLKQQATELLQKCEELEVQLCSAVTSSDAELERMRESVKLLQRQNADLEGSYACLQSTASECRNANEQLLQQVSVLETALADACSENKQYRLQNDELRNKVLELQSSTAHIEEESASMLSETRKALEAMQQLKVKSEDECARLEIIVKEKQSYIDEILKAASDNKDKLEEMHAEKEQLQKEKELLSRYLSELQSELANAEDAVREAKQEKEALITSGAELQDMVKTKTSELNELQVLLNSKAAELKALKDNAVTEQSGLLVKVSEMTRSLELRSGELDLVKSELSDYKVWLSAAQEGASRYSQDLQAAQEEIKSLIREIGDLRMKLEETLEQVALKDDALEKMAQQRQILKSSVEKLTSERLELQEKLQKMAELEEQCTAADTRVSDLERAVRDKDAVHEQLLTELDKARKELSNLANAYEARVSELQEEVGAYKSEQRCWLESERALQDELAMVREQKDEVTKIMEEMIKQSHITAKELEMSALSTAALRAELERMNEEFLETKRKLEEEVSCYAAKVASQNECCNNLEAQLDGLRQEKKLLECTLQANTSELQSRIADLTAAITLKDEALAGHEADGLQLRSECQRLQDLEQQYRTAVADRDSQLQALRATLEESKRYTSCLEEKLESLQNSATNDIIEKLQIELAEMNKAFKLVQEQAKCQMCEIENLKKQLTLKESPDDVSMASMTEGTQEQVTSCSGPLLASHAFAQLSAVHTDSGRSTLEVSSAEVHTEELSTAPKREQDSDALLEELTKLRAVTQELEAQMGLKDKELRCTKEQLDQVNLQIKASVGQAVTESAAEETKESQGDRTEKTEAELKKLKLAFKKARGELRLKVKILEDRTCEVEELKEQNLSLQTDLQRTVETLAEEKVKAKELAKRCEECDTEIGELKCSLQEIAEKCQAVQNELIASSEALTAKASECDDMQDRLGSVTREFEAASRRIYELEQETEERSREARILRDQLEHMRAKMESDATESARQLAQKSQESEALRTEVEQTKSQLDKLSAEYADVLSSQSRQEEAVHGELDILNTDIQRLNTENAEIMRLKAEEVEALQEQLQLLKDDLIRYIDIANEKSQEVHALHEKLESSQASLDKLLGEHSALSEVLVEEDTKEISDGEAQEKGMQGYDLAERVKKMIAREEAKANMLQASLHEQLQEVNITRQKLLSAEDEMQKRDLRLKEYILNLQGSLHEGCVLPEVIIQHDQGRDIYQGLVALVNSVKARFQSLHEENQYLLQETTQFRLMAENLQSDIESLSAEKERLQEDCNTLKESSATAPRFMAEEQATESKVDGYCQTDNVDHHETYEKGQIDTMSEKEELLHQVSCLQGQLAELRTKQEPSEVQQASSGAAALKEDHEETKKELLASKVKSGKMLTKLKIFKEKSEKMEEEIKKLQDSNRELEERVAHYEGELKKDSEEKAALEELYKTLQEQVSSRVPLRDHNLVVEELRNTLTRLQTLEKEKDELSDKVGILSDHNRRLEVEASHLQSELSSLKEQAEMLTSDNESFQGLVESLQHSKLSLEQELRTQHEHHSKLIKEKENELAKTAYEVEMAYSRLASMNEDYMSLQEKYNEIVYRHRNLEEQLHFSAEEKKQLERKCAALEDECSCIQETAMMLKKQTSEAEQGSLQNTIALKQEHEELKRQFERMKANQLKTEERLVGMTAQEQEATTVQVQLEEAKIMILKLKEDTEKKASEILELMKKVDELKHNLASVVEESQAKENKWVQEKKQLKHIEQHLKEAAQKLGDELQELKVKYEEALHSKLQLRDEVEQAQKDKRALAQQLQNWRSYIKDIEGNQSLEARGRSVEVDQLKLELEHTTKTLHQIGLQNEELTADLNKSLEEKKKLQQQLAATQESLQEREAQLLHLHSNISSSNDSYVINMDPPAQPHLERKLQELQQTNEVLLSNWRQEQQRRRLIEEELDSSALVRQSRTPPRSAHADSRRLLPKEDVVKIPETNYSITRQFKSHAYKLRRWLQGRQSTTSSSVLHV